ncbi:MAG: hypothetical protein AB2L09_05760 [Coriobacteriia bacterium]
MKISTKNLFLVAGSVWLLAGLNVVSVGLRAADGRWTLPMRGAELAVFVAFLFMFLRMAKKHTKRISSYESPKTNVFKFLDTRSYLIMGFMVALGVTLRVSGLVPDSFIVWFYSGLGSALALAGVAYYVYYLCTYVCRRPVQVE